MLEKWVKQVGGGRVARYPNNDNFTREPYVAKLYVTPADTRGLYKPLSGWFQGILLGPTHQF